MENASYDKDFNVLTREIVGFDGQNLQRLLADNLQMFCDSDGTYDYFCFAAPGTAQATDKWMVFRLDNDGSKQFADGNANFDNVATDPTLLSYSYS
jgi:hypothetical protein